MNDDYARQVLKAGRDLGVSRNGIVIAFATVFVESGWRMYANQSDPETMRFPHDAVSYDADSSGLFQQRPPWWGSAADRMDPYRSAAMFFTQLKKLNYDDPAHTLGWYAQAVQQSAFPDRYDEHIEESRQLYRRLTVEKETPPVEKILDYPRGKVGDYDGVAQTKPWDCGPASVQIILAAQGITKSEDWLIAQANAALSAADRIGENGTNHAGLLCPTLNRLLPGSGYTEVWVPRSDPNAVETFWKHLTKSIDANRGVLLNFEIPPWQGVRASRDSKPPRYPTGSTTFHYTAAMGRAVDPDGSRHVWVADPAAFGGVTGFWARLEDVVLWIVPHAYAYAATAAAPTPAPVPVPAQPITRIDELWAAFMAVEFGDQEAIGIMARTGDDLARRVLAKIEQTNPAALQTYLKSQKG